MNVVAGHASAVLVAGCVIPLAALFLVACGGDSQSTPAETRELINPDVSYAAASRFGDLVFTAGLLPESGAQTGASFPTQVEEVLDRLEATLKASGAGFDTLLKVNVYLTNWDTGTRSTPSMFNASDNTVRRRARPLKSVALGTTP